MKKVLGIIGGVGTAATDKFCSLLTKLTPAKTDQDHIERILHNNPLIPDRTQEIEQILAGKITLSDSQVVKEMIRSTEILHNAGASLYVIPCNTIHYFLPEMLRQNTHSKTTFVDIVEEVAKYCCLHNLQKVGLLGTKGTYLSAIYPKEFNKYNIQVIHPSQKGMDNIMDAIYGQKGNYFNGLGIKNGVKYHRSKRNQKLLIFAIKELFKKGAEALILGCTELSICICPDDLKAHHLPQTKMIDSLEILANACIEKIDIIP